MKEKNPQGNNIPPLGEPFRLLGGDRLDPLTLLVGEGAREELRGLHLAHLLFDEQQEDPRTVAAREVVEAPKRAW